MTDYGASNAGLLEHVGSALTLVTIVMNRTIVFQCSSNVNSDSIFLVTEKYLVFTFLLVKLVQKNHTKFGTRSVRVKSWQMYCYYALT